MTESDVEMGKLYAGHKDGIWYRARLCSIVGTDLVSTHSFYLFNSGRQWQCVCPAILQNIDGSTQVHAHA